MADGREEKDRGEKEVSKGKSGYAPPETKSWLRHCQLTSVSVNSGGPRAPIATVTVRGHIRAEREVW